MSNNFLTFAVLALLSGNILDGIEPEASFLVLRLASAICCLIGAAIYLSQWIRE